MRKWSWLLMLFSLVLFVGCESEEEEEEGGSTKKKVTDISDIPNVQYACTFKTASNGSFGGAISVNQDKHGQTYVGIWVKDSTTNIWSQLSLQGVESSASSLEAYYSTSGDLIGYHHFELSNPSSARSISFEFDPTFLNGEVKIVQYDKSASGTILPVIVGERDLMDIENCTSL